MDQILAFHRDVKSRDKMTIGELANQCRLATHTLRHGEAAGPLAPVRRVNGGRYGPDVLARVMFIRQSKELGFGLDQVRAMLDTTDPAARKEVLARHDAELKRRSASATAARELIGHGLRRLAPDLIECPNCAARLEAWIPPAHVR
jgi:DNA-binding transcriptional MerR regulator